MQYSVVRVEENNLIHQAITVAMISYNDEGIIGECLNSIRKQDYPQQLINIVLVDGGSTDNTLDIASKYGAQVIQRNDLLNEPDIRVSIALTYSQTPLILFLSADNRLMEFNLLSRMVSALQDSECIAVESLRYGYRQSDPIFSKYCALIGGADPIAVGLGKADRAAHDQSRWFGHKLNPSSHNPIYINFPRKISAIPTLGANGCLMRTDLIRDNEYAKSGLHIDMIAMLIMEGRGRIAFIPNAHVNHFLKLSLINFIKRRIHYALMYSGDKKKRFYNVVTYNDYPKLIILVIANLTILIPLLRSIKGFLYKPDFAWFLHPIVAAIFTISYSLMVLNGAMNKVFLFFKGERNEI